MDDRKKIVLNVSCTNGHTSKTLIMKSSCTERKCGLIFLYYFEREGPPAVRRTWGPAKKFYLLQVGLISHLEIELAYSKNIYNSIWERCKLLFPSHNRNHILFIKMLQNHRNWYMMDKGDKWNHSICLPFSPDLLYPTSPTCHNSFS